MISAQIRLQNSIVELQSTNILMSIKALILLVLLSALAVIGEGKRFSLRLPWSDIKTTLVVSADPPPYQTLYYTQKISHFNFKMTGKTFKQKYLINLTSWSKQEKGPILIYCGNEGSIQTFYRNTGWYNDYVTNELKGLLVYIQHRYFGVSWPFGDEKNSTTQENLIYLTTDEALMDFVQFIQFLKKTYCSDCPVIAFGGSFAGNLATWMRMKYPNVVDMAHASSAPLYYYHNRKDFDIGIIYKLVTKNYQIHNENCPNTIRQAFKRLVNYNSTSKAPISDLSKWFNLCTPLKVYTDISYLINYIEIAYSYMTMINYPYPTSFLKNVTAWPANSSCIPLDSVSPSSSDESLFVAIKKSIQYYYSFGKEECNQIYEDTSLDEDDRAWDILACGDQAMPMNQDGINDMFYPEYFDYDAYNAACFKNHGILPDYDFTLNHFGGITDKEYLSASNIVFTNGGLDPWSGASILKDLSSTLVTCVIPDGAHHLDLRPPNSADPVEAHQCREFVLKKLKEWIAAYKLSRHQEHSNIGRQ